MQYKIPVQIENDDPIIFNLSLKQLMIIMAGMGIGYLIFGSLSKNFETEIAAIPAIIIAIISVIIAKFNYYEMNFIKFIFAFIRYKVNLANRKWIKGVDSFSLIEIGYINKDKKSDKKVDFGDKLNKMKKIDEKLEKI